MFQQKKNNDGRRGAPGWLKSKRNNEGVVPRSIVALCCVLPEEQGRAFFSFYHSLPLGREASVVFAWAMLACLWAGGKRFMGRRCSFFFLAKGWFFLFKSKSLLQSILLTHYQNVAYLFCYSPGYSRSAFFNLSINPPNPPILGEVVEKKMAKERKKKP